MLKHYGMYLNTDDPEDSELIATLDRYVKSRRVGEFLRAASLAYTSHHTVAASTFTFPALGATVAPIMSSAAPVSLVEKARKAFFK